jgi:uncharacterized protein involved in exopolysaccharide biosynthesis
VYTDVAKSDALLGRIAEGRYATSAGDSVTLIQFLKISGDSPELRRARALRMLATPIQATATARTGVVTLSATFSDPLIAKAVVQRIIDELVRFNVETRQTQASAERRFTERQLKEAKDSLSDAESNLRGFLKANRGDYRSSPDLMLEQDRLSRRVTMQQQISTTLAQAYEQAKIEEVRDTPVITVLQPPERPVLPNSRRTVVKTAIGFFLGLVLAILIVLARTTLSRRREAGERDVEELAMAWQGVRRALRLHGGSRTSDSNTLS